MKEQIHPTYHNKISATCACGNSFEVGSTQEKIEVEVCSSCHPFYTGKQKLVDAAGRVDKFQQKLASVAKKKKKTKTTEHKSSKKKPKSDQDVVKLN